MIATGISLAITVDIVIVMDALNRGMQGVVKTLLILDSNFGDLEIT
jgi:hypothetical protein